MHYVDEGTGEVVLFVHGNPTWSFMYRHLIKGLGRGYRCVAPDHIGFGLSDKPRGVSYVPQFHAENLEGFIDALGLKDITLVIHDWGGPVGMAYAIRHPENIKRIVVFNTTCWSLKDVKAAVRFSAFIGSPIGHFLCRYLNAFPRFMIPGLFGDRSRLTKNDPLSVYRAVLYARFARGSLGSGQIANHSKRLDGFSVGGARCAEGRYRSSAEEKTRPSVRKSSSGGKKPFPNKGR